MTAKENVILVDENDQQIGTAEKLAAHENNQLHRAFSIFIYRKNNEVEILLQQRAKQKYHSPDLWTNTCCSHPREGEDIIAAGVRRLCEEMRITAKLTSLGWFKYQAAFPNGLFEHEIDHVLVGEISSELEFEVNPDEVQAVRWVTVKDLEAELSAEPERFTPWLKPALELVKAYFERE